ncbi:hypothetical protein [Luteitalea sp. TBR-22]|uniref:hypothetical protein n=1 Tax=Luteitalea sp. TBR-22 TaxID=2802971 RepID=UPI001EF563C2|nr:hypothetical protein [Luteitalea sp. TBR-22]
MSGVGAVVGVVERGSTAVLVTIGPDMRVLDRRRVDLIAPGLPTHPHHHEGSWAVGRYLGTPGARPMPLADAVALVEQVRASAERLAGSALDSLAADVPAPITRLALRACPPLPPTVEARIRDHRAQAMADSVMYRRALAGAASERGWSVHWYDVDRVHLEVAAVLGRDDVEVALREMGRGLGPPWQEAHRRAAAAALAARR